MKQVAHVVLSFLIVIETNFLEASKGPKPGEFKVPEVENRSKSLPFIKDQKSAVLQPSQPEKATLFKIKGQASTKAQQQELANKMMQEFTAQNNRVAQEGLLVSPQKIRSSDAIVGVNNSGEQAPRVGRMAINQEGLALGVDHGIKPNEIVFLSQKPVVDQIVMMNSGAQVPILDVPKFTAAQKTQGVEKGIPIKYPADKMTAPLENYVHELNTKYPNIAKKVPEIFPSYALKFLTTIKPGLADWWQIFTPKTFRNKLYSWDIPSNKESEVYNFSSGIDLLNKLLDPGAKEALSLKNPNYDGKDLQPYFEILRKNFPHVPDNIVKLFLIECLNNQYVPVPKFFQKLSKNYVELSPEQLQKQLNLLKESSRWATDFDKGLQAKELLINRDSDNKINIKLSRDPKSLSSLDELYLTVNAIEATNKEFAENTDYNQFLVKIGKSSDPAKNILNLDNRVQSIISNPENGDILMLSAGIERDFSKPASWETNQIKAKLEENYPSYAQVVKSKKDQQTIDRLAFNQMQIDFLKLSENIKALEKKFNIEVKEDVDGKIDNMMLTFTPPLESNNDPRSNVVTLLKEAMTLQKKMSKEIIDQRIADFKSRFVPSKGFEVAHALEYLKSLTNTLKHKGESDTVKLWNNQVDVVDATLRTFLSEIEQVKKYVIIQEGKIDSLDKLKELPEEDALEILNKSEKKLERLRDDFRAEKNKDKELLQAEALAEIKLDKKELEQKLEMANTQADIKFAEIVKLQEQVQPNKNLAQQQIVLFTLEQLLQEAQNIRKQNKGKIPQKVINDIQRLLENFKNEAFAKQDCSTIEKKLLELSQENPKVDVLRLYWRIFQKVDQLVEPLQKSLRLEIQVNDRVVEFNNILLDIKKQKQEDITPWYIQGKMRFIEKKIKALKTLAAEKDPVYGTLKSESVDKNEIAEFNTNLEPKYRILEITKLKDLIVLYEKVLEDLTSRYQKKVKNSSSGQMKENLAQAWEKLQDFNITEFFEKSGEGLMYTPGAIGDVNNHLTTGVRQALGPVWNKMSPTAQGAVIIAVAGLSTTLIKILSNNFLNDDQKKDLQKEAYNAFSQDVMNIVAADLTGADMSVVATGNAQAILTSAGFNKAINTLLPDNNGMYGNNNIDISSSKLSQFQNQYAGILNNNSGLPTTSYANSYFSSSNSGYAQGSYSVQNHANNLYSSPSNSYAYSQPVTRQLPRLGYAVPSYESLSAM